MKPRSTSKRNHALILIEMLVIIAVLAVLAVMLLPYFVRAKIHGGPSCETNLMQIGMAGRIWADDNNDKYPFELSITNGGTMELNYGRNVWLNFLVMSNELSTPKILVCPEDKNRLPPCTNFSSQLAGHVSYFIDLDARRDVPRSVLSGDDNFEIDGISTKPGLLELSSNAPIAWTSSRHIKTGHLLLNDGSVQFVTISGLRTCLQQTGLTTNSFFIP